MNPALSAVSSVFSLLMQRLCLLRRDLLLLSLVPELPWFFDILLLRASQLPSPAQKRVMSVMRAAIDLGFSYPMCRASHSSRMLCLKTARPRRPDSRLFDFSWLGTVSRIVWLIPLAAGLCGLGHRRMVVAHKCPGSCQGMRIPGLPTTN